jgi:hypothetical protein
MSTKKYRGGFCNGQPTTFVAKVLHVVERTWSAFSGDL